MILTILWHWREESAQQFQRQSRPIERAVRPDAGVGFDHNAINEIKMIWY